MMTEKIKATILGFLTSSGYISEEKARDILYKEPVYRAHLVKARGPAFKRDSIAHDINIIDIIDSLRLKIPWDEKSFITEDVVMEEIAKHLEMPFVKINPLSLNSDTVTKIVTKPYAIKHQLVPVSLKDGALTVATSNPFGNAGVEGLKQSSEYAVSVAVATKTDIFRIINEFYGFQSSVDAAQRESKINVNLGNLEQFVKLKAVSEMDASDKHVVNAVEYILHYAYSLRASDIHIEPKREFTSIRFRMDGVLHHIHRIPATVHPAIVSRIKMLARMDISEKRRPQDGRIKTEHEGKEIELRISTLPVAFGEKIVIRIFDPNILIQKLDELGFLEKDLQTFRSFITAPYGLILVTGPTGSGKTTTLYSALKEVSSPEINLTTIEDPVEMVYEEFNQTSIQPIVGVTFGSSLRTILRQDPDVIMVGEIRDQETAENAIQAALTGHLVMSTLHTNDAPSSVARLIDLGVPAFMLNSTLIGVMAQRLVRRVCAHCAEKYEVTEADCNILGVKFDAYKDKSISIGSGCNYCRGTGYLGRVAIVEIMDVNDDIRTAIEKGATPIQLRQVARKFGFTALREDAIKKVFMGMTTIDEVVRVTGFAG